jgi:hypothetical protein
MAAVSVVCGMILGGCGPLVTVGRNVDTAKLEQELRPKASTMDDVRRILGPPEAVGSAMLPVHASPRALWYYAYAEGSLSDARQQVLLVFFDHNLYDGYMWYSSLPGTGPP